MSSVLYSVFTKPWKNLSLEQLAALVQEMGFDAVEFPLRKGFQVEPSDGMDGLKKLSQVFRSFDLKVTSIATGLDVGISEGNQVIGLDESVFAGCAEIGARVIRICQGLDRSLGFHENLEVIRRKYDLFLPMLEKYGLTLGVQMHCGMNISTSAETYLLIKDYPPEYIGAVWDSGHNGLAGTDPAMAIDAVWEHLCMVNFKAAFRRRTNGPEAAAAEFDEYWTTGDHGCGSWKAAVDCLKARHFSGVVCLPAEYSDEENVVEYAKKDLLLVRELFRQQ